MERIFSMLVYDFSDDSVVVSVEIETEPSHVARIDLMLSLDGLNLMNKSLSPGGQRTHKVTFDKLGPGLFYKVEAVARLTDGRASILKTLLVFTSSSGNRSVHALDRSEPIGRPESRHYSTKNSFSQAAGVCDSEKEFGSTFENDPHLIKLVGGKKALQKALMDGRKAKDLNSYLNQNYKFAKPKENQNERLKRALCYGNAVIKLQNQNIFNDDLQEGHNFFQNTWGMGPFYSYNKNFEHMKKERQRLDSRAAGSLAIPRADSSQHPATHPRAI